jgi:large subunit ribosomal protein L17
LKLAFLATRQCVTGLIVNERVEYTKARGIIVREYTERLLHEAIQHGDRHVPTMELANWWLTDKSAIHKLFKVLVPRLRDLPGAYTRILRAPILYKPEGGPMMCKERVVLELRGHPFPQLNYSNSEPNRKLIHNVLLSEARREAKLKEEFDLRHPTS